MTALTASLRALLVPLAVAACAPGTRAQTPADPAGDANSALPPIGFGTLSQSDVSVLLRDNQVELRFLLLDERVTRLLAPDAYQALSALVRQHRPAIDSIARSRGLSSPSLALVTFQGRVPQARFDPQLISVLVRGMPAFPLGTVPLGPEFSNRELGIRGQARAIYLFEEMIPVYEPWTLAYGSQQSAAWESRIQLLTRERGSAVRRAQAADTTGGR
jgi:hypothetical protein